MSTPSTPAKITILSGLWNRGYHVVRGFMTAEEVAMALAGVDAVPESKWLRSTATEKRLQAVLNLSDNINANPPIYRLAYERLVDFASRLHHAWAVDKKWAIVEVQKGCPPEELHRDFQPAETTAAITGHEWVQSSVLVALHEGTKLLVVPEAFSGSAIRSSTVELELRAGDMVLYRGDLPHADPVSADRNVHVVARLLVDGIEHTGAVEPVAWGFYRCNYCFKRCESKRALSNHERYCDNNPNKQEIARKRKANNDKGAYCAKCDRHFGKKNTYDVHKC